MLIYVFKVIYFSKAWYLVILLWGIQQKFFLSSLRFFVSFSFTQKYFLSTKVDGILSMQGNFDRRHIETILK